MKLTRMFIAAGLVVVAGCESDPGESRPDSAEVGEVADTGAPDGADGADVSTAPDGTAGTDATTAPTDIAETSDTGPEVIDPIAKWGAPLDPYSPWPKFRRDLAQTGRSDVLPTPSETRMPWVFQTFKGVFSSPVIDADGTVYIGSADRGFYAIDRDGNQRWRFATGEIVDSAGLLDDAGRVIFGSGSGYVIAVDRVSGTELWRFAADLPAVNSAFIRWFEGNIGILPDGTLIAPNDNFCTYAIGRSDGARRWCYRTADQTWSLPAVDAATGRLFLGNNFYFGQNIIALEPAGGTAVWTGDAQGSVAASPLLIGAHGAGAAATPALVVVGGFDGYLRALAQDGGDPVWATALNDHIYASPSLAAAPAGSPEAGTIIQPGTDGTVYAIAPSDGRILWRYDVGAPIRSSAAIDGAGNIYVGGGDGRLWCLSADGTLRWSEQLVHEDRNDLNASPALANDGIVIAGESGEVFFVPWDFCLRASELNNPDCVRGPGQALPADTTELRLTTRFGSVVAGLAADIEPNEAVTLSLLERAGGDTVLAVIDSATLSVTVTPPVPVTQVVSGDRKFIVLVPEAALGWTAGSGGGTVSVRVKGQSLVAPFVREGLKLTGGAPGVAFDHTFTLTVPARGSDVALEMPPFAVGPTSESTRHTDWELWRLAAPLPTILPSYNQIGFDSIHYLVGIVAGDPSPGGGSGKARHGLAWAIGAFPTEQGTVRDANSRVRFPLEITWDGTLLTLDNQSGFGIDFNGFTLPFSRFRLAGTLAPGGGGAAPFGVFAQAVCAEIDFYGTFLRQLGFCNPDSDVLAAVGAVELTLAGVAGPNGSTGVVEWDLVFGDAVTVVRANLTGGMARVGDHNYGILAVDEADRPVACDYVEGTTVTADANKLVTAVSLRCPTDVFIARAWLMFDTSAEASESWLVP